MDKIKALIKIKQLIRGKKRRNVKASRLEEIERLITANLDISTTEIKEIIYGQTDRNSSFRSLKFRLQTQQKIKLQILNRGEE